jgi:ABC-type Mn2+/Zn2+ transport system ATPase subunit
MSTAEFPLLTSILLAGPNGAGKSTSAAHLLKGALAVEERGVRER